MSAVDGTWDVTMSTPGGAQQATLTLTSDGTSLSGAMVNPMATMEITDGTVDGNNVAWTSTITQPMAMTLEFTGTVDGDTIKGDAKMGQFGSAPWEGTRTA